MKLLASKEMEANLIFESGVVVVPTSITAPDEPVSSALHKNLPVLACQLRVWLSAEQSVSAPPVVLGNQKALAEAN